MASAAQPPSSDPSTREALLDAAEPLFAAHGFASTTIKQIAAAAGVNSALLYYYFDDKASLYRAMLARLIGGIIAKGMQGVALTTSPDAALRAVLAAQRAALQHHPGLPRLMLREIIDHQAEHALPAVGELMRQLVGGVTDVIRRGQEAGVFRRDLDPAFAAISTLAQLNWFVAVRPLARHVVPFDMDDPATFARFAEHAATFALAALTSQESA